MDSKSLAAEKGSVHRCGAVVMPVVISSPRSPPIFLKVRLKCLFVVFALDCIDLVIERGLRFLAPGRQSLGWACCEG